MAKPVDHDALSATGTVAGSAVKWGVIAAIACVALPAVFLGSIAGVAGALIGAGLGGVVAVAATPIAGTVGLFKGGSRVARERQAHRDATSARDFSLAHKANDREIAGMQQGYMTAMQDMQPMVSQREKLAFEQGQQSVVQKIQEQMDAQAAAQNGAKAPAGAMAASTADGAAAKSTVKGGFADKELSLNCESKAQAVLKQRELDALAPKQLS